MKKTTLLLLAFMLAAAGLVACAQPAAPMPAEEPPAVEVEQEVVTAEAVETPTYFYSNGQQIEVEIATDMIAVVLEDDADLREDRLPSGRLIEPGDRLLAFDQEGVYFVRLDDDISRDELEKFESDLREQSERDQVGLVLYLPDTELPVVMTDEFIVRFKDNVTEEQMETMLAELGAEVVGPNAFVENQYLMRVLPGSSNTALDVANSYYESGLVEYAHPNFIIPSEERDHYPDDAIFEDQWHLYNTGQGGGTIDADVDAPEAWSITMGDPGTIIAIIDSGVQIDHPDLVQNKFINYAEVPDNLVDDDGNGFVDDVSGWNFYTDSGIVYRGYASRHGTAAAGVAAARGNNTIGISGMCPLCTILPIARGSNVADHADSIRYAVAMGADIISNSWGYQIGVPTTDDVVSAINEAAKVGRDGLGSVVLFAMTNRKEDNCTGANPDISSLNSVIAVSSATNLDEVGHAGFGDCIDIIAPTHGGTLGITTVDQTGYSGYTNGDYYRNFSGTSAATPLVAGIVGLMLDLKPDLTWEQVKRILEESAEKIQAHEACYDEDGFSNTHGFGRVNAYRAIVPTVKITLIPETVEAGEPFTVKVTGTSLNGISDVRWFGDNSGIPTIDQQHSHNVANGSHVHVIVHDWPNQTIQRAGAHRICADVRTVPNPDRSDNQPHHAFEGSKIACAQIQVNHSIQEPDLIAVVSAPASAAAGSDVEVPITVGNSGAGPAFGTENAGSDGYTVDIVLSTDTYMPEGWATYSPNYEEDVLLKGGRISNTTDLASGQEKSYVYNYEIPADTPGDNYYICARIDSARKIAETDEANNVSCSPIQIRPADENAFTISVPRIDGIVSKGEWDKALLVTDFPHGRMLYMNDNNNLYLLMDVTGDTVNELGEGDYFWLTVDVNENSKIDSDTDINYGIYPSTRIIGIQYYMEPGGATGLQATASQLSAGFGPSTALATPHVIWEFALRLSEIQANPGENVHIGVRAHSETPRFTHDLPTYFFDDFSELLEFNLGDVGN